MSLGLNWSRPLIIGSSYFNPAPILASPLVGSDLSEQDVGVGGRAGRTGLTPPTFCPQYVGALEDMLQALKAQAR